VRVRACSRGRRPRPLSTKQPRHAVGVDEPRAQHRTVAGVGGSGRRSPAMATILGYLNRWAAQIVSPIVILFIVSCANLAPPPDVSPDLISNARPDHVDAAQLQDGRRLFVSHCLECHTLPRVTKYNREQWPHLVSRMAARANLSASDQKAITVYLRAASQQRSYLAN
jgi:mono/diheme cytochrome c family protein